MWKDILKNKDNGEIIRYRKFLAEQELLEEKERINEEISVMLGNPTQYEGEMYRSIYEDGKEGEMSVEEYLEDYTEGRRFTGQERKLIAHFYELGLKK